MIYQGTMLRVIDNSGALTAMCIKVLRKTPTSVARHGDKIMVVVKTAVPEKKAAKSQLYKAVVVWCPSNKRRKEGSYIKFDYPACVLLKKDGQPLGNRIRGPVFKEVDHLSLREHKPDNQI